MRELIDIVEAACRLDELTCPSWTEAGEILTKAGYSLVGEGGCSEVYGRDDKDYVLKLFAASDRSYLQYLALAQANRDNPHFPRIRGRLVKINKDYNAVKLERLDPYVGDGRYYGGEDRYIWDLKCFIHALQRGQNTDQTFAESLPESLKEACALIARLKMPGRNSPLGLDMKAANVMMRGNTLVLIDPVL